MALRHFKTGGKRVRAMVPGGPSAEVLIGTGDDWPMGVARVVIPPGGGMPEHDHSSSAALLVPLDAPVTLVDAEGTDRFDVAVGSVATIPIGQRVEVLNEGSVEASVMVVFDPPDFTRQLDSWPSDSD